MEIIISVKKVLKTGWNRWVLSTVLNFRLRSLDHVVLIIESRLLSVYHGASACSLCRGVSSLSVCCEGLTMESLQWSVRPWRNEQ